MDGAFTSALPPRTTTAVVRFNTTPTVFGDKKVIVIHEKKPPSALRRRLDKFHTFLSNQAPAASYRTILIIAIANIALVALIVALSAGLSSVSPSCTSAHANASSQPVNDGYAPSVRRQRNKPWTYRRLSRRIRPLHYNLTLAPAFYTPEQSTFDGTVVIDAKVTNRGTGFVVMHTFGLNITFAAVTCNASDTGIKRTFFFEPYQYYVIELQSPARPKTRLRISLNFSGQLTDATEKSAGGFLKDSFQDPITGNKSFVATSHFEARRLFPCFDEPPFRAYFTVSVSHQPGFTALSNMPAVTTEPNDDNNKTLTTRFGTTPVPLPPSLVAIAVGRFFRLPPARASLADVSVSVWVPEHALEQSKFALKAAVHVVSWMQRFTASRYPLPKLDVVLSPRATRTELGLCSFLESHLLVDSDESLEAELDGVASRISHRLAHLWFGSMLTSNWWGNEGLASYTGQLAARSMGRLHSDVGPLQALAADDSVEPISPSSRRFGDDSSDAKAGSVIGMLASAMGRQNFRYGVQDLLAKFRFNPTTVSNNDLWTSLSSYFGGTGDVELKWVMESWLQQRSFPLVSVELGFGGEELVLRQKPFSVPSWRPGNSTGNSPEDDTARWWIPMSVSSPAPATTTGLVGWFRPDRQDFIIRPSDGLTPSEATKVNANQTVFMRVNYPDAMWLAIGRKLLSDINAYPPSDRAGLVDDCLQLARAGKASYKTALKTIGFLSGETHPMVWRAFAINAHFLDAMLWDSPQLLTFRSLVSDYVRSAREKAFRETGSPCKVLLGILAGIQVTLGRPSDSACYASRYFQTGLWRQPQWRELRRAVLTAQVVSNNTEVVLRQLSGTSSRAVRRDVLAAVGSSRDLGLLSAELEKALTSSVGRDDFFALTSTSWRHSHLHRNFLWHWGREHFGTLTKRGSTISSEKLISWLFGVGKYFGTKTKYFEFETFARRAVGSSFGENVELHCRQVLEQIRRNIYWREKMKDQLEDYLRTLPAQNYYDDTTNNLIC